MRLHGAVEQSVLGLAAAVDAAVGAAQGTAGIDVRSVGARPTTVDNCESAAPRLFARGSARGAALGVALRLAHRLLRRGWALSARAGVVAHYAGPASVALLAGLTIS